MEGGGDGEKKIDNEPGGGLSLPISSGSEEGENGGKNTDNETNYSSSSEKTKVNNKVRVYWK